MKVQLISIFVLISIIRNGKCGSSGILNDDKSKLSPSSINEAIDTDAKRELYKREGIKISKNAHGFRQYPIYKIPTIDFMEVNRLADTNYNVRNIINFDLDEDTSDADVDIFEPYSYRQPSQPLRTNTDRQSPNVRPAMIDVKSKLEDFAGYYYPKPMNPITYPDRPPIKVTTEPYIDLPPASARSLL